MGFARDKITARGRGPLARSARRAESSPPRSSLPSHAPRAYQRQPAPPGQSRAPLIKETASWDKRAVTSLPSPHLHPCTALRGGAPCTLGRPPAAFQWVAYGIPRHPAPTHSCGPGPHRVGPFAFVRVFSGARALFLGCPRCVSPAFVPVRRDKRPCAVTCVPRDIRRARAVRWCSGRCGADVVRIIPCAARWPVGDCAAPMWTYWYIALAHVRMCVLLGAMLLRCYVVRYCYAMWWGRIIRSAAVSGYSPLTPGA